MFSFFKKKTPVADQAPTAAPDPVPGELVQPTEASAPVAPAEPTEKRSWLDRLRGAPAEPAAPVPAPEPALEAAPRRSWIDKLRGGLRKTGASIAQVLPTPAEAPKKIFSLPRPALASSALT